MFIARNELGLQIKFRFVLVFKGFVIWKLKVEFYIITLVNLMYSDTLCKLFASVNTRT